MNNDKNVTSTQYTFFQHESCEYFPCHKTPDMLNFNCLFCYCPLYALGDDCGGSFTRTESEIKDCSNCALPHIRENYDYVIKKLSENFERLGKR